MNINSPLNFGFNRPINWSAVMNFSEISPKTITHLRNVYFNLAIMLLLAAAGTALHFVTAIGSYGLVTFLGALGALVWFYMTPKEDAPKRTAILNLFAVLQGIAVAPLIDVVLQLQDGSKLVALAFSGTSIIFGCFSAAALFAPRRSLLYLGGIISSLMSTMAWLLFINIFVSSSTLFDIRLYLGLIVFSLFVIFDTQVIVEKAEQSHDYDVPAHSLELFIDFIGLFIRILTILAKNSKKKEEEKKKK